MSAKKEHVVVALDDGPHSERALEWVLKSIGAGVELHLVSSLRHTPPQRLVPARANSQAAGAIGGVE